MHLVVSDTIVVCLVIAMLLLGVGICQVAKHNLGRPFGDQI